MVRYNKLPILPKTRIDYISPPGRARCLPPRVDQLQHAKQNNY